MPNNKNQTAKPRRGTQLTDGKAHATDHGRRSFLFSLGAAGAGGLLLNKFPVSTFSPSPLTQALVEGDDERILVFIRLKGGNDGLNTVIPIHDYGTYQTARPNLSISRDEVVRFAPEVNLHPRLNPLRGLWDNGRMHVVNNVGYDAPSLSHFQSSDIWATASDSDDLELTGVLGSYLEETLPDFLTNPPDTPPAIQIGGSGNLLFNNSDDFNYALSTENPVQLENIVSSGRLYNVTDLPDCTYGEQLGYVRAVANTTFRYAGVLADAYSMGRNTVEYLDDSLGRQLAIVSRLIRGGLKTRLYVVELDGFDTHATQLADHANLMGSLASNTSAFFEDMEKGGHDDRVLAATFSEFGRRVHENGSAGTDHGTAAPMMLFGKGLNGSATSGGQADMVNTDADGNMIHGIDFRRVYASIFSSWLCLPDTTVSNMLGGEFMPLDTLGLACRGITSTSESAIGTVRMSAYRSGPDIVVEYDLATGNTPVAIHLFDISGKRLGTPYRGRGDAGANTQHLPMRGTSLASGIYVVSLEVGGRMYSRKLGLFR